MNKYNFKSPILKELDPDGYHFFGLWKQNLFSACFWASCWSKEVAEKLGIESKEGGALVLCDGNFLAKKSEIENIEKQICQKIDQRDESFFKHMVDVADEYFKSSVIYGETLSNKALTAENFYEFLQVAREINFLWMLGAEQFSEAAQKKLTETAHAESFPDNLLQKIIPKFDTPLNQQHREVLELKRLVGTRTLDEVKSDKNIFSKIADHVKRFAWIEIANFEGSPLSAERLYEQIIHAKDEETVSDDVDYKVYDNLAFHALALSYCGYIRQAGAEYFFMLSEKAQPFLIAIAEKFGLTYREFLLQRDTEILDALNGKISAQNLKQNAERRKDMNFVIFAGMGNEVFFCEEKSDIEILRKIMLPQADVKSKVISGQIGNTGKYTGVARIIMNTHDFSKMQPGDVLVSTMTTPDFVVLMHKAGAIVTDIGGMLCHAAIVSREINKPCVIGTKFATQIIRDGDMVEVDAEKGIVKII